MTIQDDQRYFEAVIPDLRSGKLEAALAIGEQIYRARGWEPSEFFLGPEIDQLRRVYKAKPKILWPCGPDNIRTLQLVASAACVVGITRFKYVLPEGFSTGLHMDNDSAVRMVLFSAAHARQMERFRQVGIRKVRWHASTDADQMWRCCIPCEEMRDKEFELDLAPEQPYELCVSRLGCRCDYFMVNPDQ